MGSATLRLVVLIERSATVKHKHHEEVIMKKPYAAPKLVDRGSAIALTLESIIMGVEPATNLPDFKGTL